MEDEGCEPRDLAGELYEALKKTWDDFYATLDGEPLSCSEGDCVGCPWNHESGECQLEHFELVIMKSN